MALKHRSLAATVTAIFLAAHTCAFPTAHDATVLDDTPVNLTSRQDVSASAFYFWGWNGCNTDDHPDWSSVIESAWGELLEIGKSVSSDIDFTSDQAGDFLGSPDNNQDYQTEINDLECPLGTHDEDVEKCNSRCWRAITQKDSSGNDVVSSWVPRAAAYTTNHNGVDVTTINFWSSFFTLGSCPDRIASMKPITGERDRLLLRNYECRGYVALHELFHINAMVNRVAYRIKHVYDRKIQIWSPHFNKQVVVQVYGGEYTKTMARWTKNTGWWVATNADNFAQYALAMWVTGQIGDYPRYPIVSEQPTDEPFGTLDNSGTISQTDDPVKLGEALGVAPEDAYNIYLNDASSCSDAGSDGPDNATTADCSDTVENGAVDLSPEVVAASTSTPPVSQPTSTPPASQPTSTPVPPTSTATMARVGARRTACHVVLMGVVSAIVGRVGKDEHTLA
ncbi:uncharacterized protein BDZ99DRAFT_470115 [Mytilinidion resinicola]|uniref:Uncharacterized protein n=1 Tax=Mytilinidion resinicola TaxID=574789 RepID=A0A6A6Z7H3_9PEZI|nr:uncharacterized protein BDZ99DRAFT_470115 [Mytilinidion resinicola]KAF2817052.1 hypothetical protein BDZ99DRAFT_470115 [Mytilinidion resinicola]